MSTVEHEAALEAADTQDTERAERPVLRREFAAEIHRGDGRTVDVRVVPYGETITHNDGLGGVPKGVDYSEQWMPGVFAHQLSAANRVVGNVEHERGIGGMVARAVALRDVPGDGFHASFRMLKGQDGDKALELIEEGVLDGVSLEAAPVKSVKAGGVVQRVKANLFGVAFTRFAAYSGARVLAVREEPMLLEETETFPDMDPELVARCRQLGIRLPQRFEAHPQTGTPAETGTPADGTRQPTGTTQTEE